MSPIKEFKFLVIDPKRMEISELVENEFKIIVFKKLSKLQENNERQLKKFRKKLTNQRRISTKIIKTINKQKFWN